MSWEFLIDETLLASVIPDDYAVYRRPIRAALGAFLDWLPAEHQAEVLNAQAALPADSSISLRLGTLARTCPALHKLGQVLARDRRLAPELRAHLQELESLPPTVPLEILEQILEREIGPLDSLGIALDPPALAEASVAIVIPFRWQHAPPAGVNSPGGVFKILKPGIETRLVEELQLLEKVGALLDQRCGEFQIQPLDYADTFQRVREKLSQEIRLDLEQQHLEQARDFYQGQPQVLIPRLFPFCSARVTAMERVYGVKITDKPIDSVEEGHALAHLVVSSLLARPILTHLPVAMFHADPHAGNLFLSEDGRLAILDWSLTGHLGERERAKLVQIGLSAITFDAKRLAEILGSLAITETYDRAALHALSWRAIRSIRLGQFPGFAWLVNLLDEAVQTARLRVAPDLMLFRKSLLTIEGVVADLHAGDDLIHHVLQAEFMREFLWELPYRCFAPPLSRRFGTRLSNADLFELFLSAPLIATRFAFEPSLATLQPAPR
jgi:ubiquinone biosynthesis protein